MGWQSLYFVTLQVLEAAVFYRALVCSGAEDFDSNTFYQIVAKPKKCLSFCLKMGAKFSRCYEITS